ncbi:helix-turn-helix domain-containing protein [Desertivirga brevis]|uniref:helix-turn-helix domain-containing protein n=1 Tax=Desertivirga brevis TaxID=2810310 RepID=UPI001A96DE0B|nr:XRE family transcriptional regulator [Pedobacter sp. SYSU D00873]
MTGKPQWYLIESEDDYNNAVSRYEQIKRTSRGSDEHKEKVLLAHLISQYKKSQDDLPEVDPVELIKIRMEDFGYKSANPAKEYGDKGTISKVLNYKQALSLTMIRKFSRLLQIPVEALIKEYKVGN